MFSALGPKPGPLQSCNDILGGFNMVPKKNILERCRTKNIHNSYFKICNQRNYLGHYSDRQLGTYEDATSTEGGRDKVKGPSEEVVTILLHTWLLFYFIKSLTWNVTDVEPLLSCPCHHLEENRMVFTGLYNNWCLLRYSRRYRRVTTRAKYYIMILVFVFLLVQAYEIFGR